MMTRARSTQLLVLRFFVAGCNPSASLSERCRPSEVLEASFGAAGSFKTGGHTARALYLHVVQLRPFSRRRFVRQCRNTLALFCSSPMVPRGQPARTDLTTPQFWQLIGQERGNASLKRYSFLWSKNPRVANQSPHFHTLYGGLPPVRSRAQLPMQNPPAWPIMVGDNLRWRF